MQDTLKKAAPAFRFLLRWVLPVLIAYAVWRQFERQQQDLGGIWQHFQAAARSGSGLLLALTLGLTALNWGLEARKWQVLARKLQPLGFRTAYKAILAGQSLGFVSQANAGDLAAKMGFLDARHRLAGIGALLLGNTLQFLITLTAGCLAYSYFLYRFPENASALHYALLAALWATVLLTAWLLSLRSRAVGLLRRSRLLHRGLAFFEVLERYPAPVLWQVAGLSGLRYVTFTVQFLLVLRLFGLGLPLTDQLTVVWLLFLVKSIVPAFSFLSDLGLRTLATVYFFGPYGVNAAQVTAASLAVWAINILLPVLVGTLFVGQLRYFSSEEKNKT